ncbi:MAG: hypothetical protein OES47_00135 [Acidobacteriota bacterium]|nr:hypothetical protein [Acidobacteriota bacterium]
MAGLKPSAVPPHVFAVDGDRLRYARFHPDRRGLELREYWSEDLEPGLFPEGQLAGPARDAHRLDEALKALLERSSLTVHEASLVLPDRWLRLASTEAADVPRKGRDRAEVIRFKLKRLVPFRVEDLRVADLEAAGTDDSGARLLLGFASEALLTQLEDVFAGNGVRIGQLSNEGLSLLVALQGALAGQETGVLLHATNESYSVIVARRGAPILHRFKSLTQTEPNWDLVVRDLKLTRRFVVSQSQVVPLAEVTFVGSPEVEAGWSRAVERAFEVPVRSVASEWEEIPGTVEGVSPVQAAPLLGAAARTIR